MNAIQLFDTTLRDGEQAPACSMDLAEKLELAQGLERLGVDIIEAGFAAASPGDFQAVQAVARSVRACRVASLARATMRDIDAAWEALQDAAAPRIHTFLATSPTHMRYKLKLSPEAVLDAIAHNVAYARQKTGDVEFSAEDATRSERPFLAQAVQTAIAAGASVVNIPDTVGYATPEDMAGLITYLLEHVDNVDRAILAVHCHNDLGLACANTLAGLAAGARQAEVTLCGLGERAGNAALEEVVMALRTRQDAFGLQTRVDTQRLHPLSRRVYAIIGVTPPLNKPIVGANAFAHEAGIHQHGMLANRETYEIMRPEDIGLRTSQMVLGKHSGRHAVEDRLSQLGYTLSGGQMDDLFARFKALCDRKKVVGDADLEALVAHSPQQQQGLYALDRFTIHSGNQATCSAVVRLRREGQQWEEVALGDGPVDAAYNAIDRIIQPGEHALENYCLQTVSEGRDAQGEATVKVSSGGRTYSGRGLSTDVLEASVLAYLNALNKLMQEPS